MDPDHETIKRFYSAILIQAFRDFCSVRAVDRASVYRWLNSTRFDAVCEGAEQDPQRTRDRFRSLSKLKPEIRKKVMSEISRSVMGFTKR